MIELRAAHRSDIAAMAAIVHAWETEVDWLPGLVSQDEIAGMLNAAIDAREIHVAVQRDDEAVVGYMSVDPNSAKIGALYLAIRGQGVGTRLLERAKAGRAFLWLQTHIPNKDAHRFYHRHGFGIAAELPPDAADEPGLYRMEWRA